MRIAGLLVIVGCAASSPPATPKLRAHPCDSAHWSELADTRLRVWPAKASAPARVVEVAGAHVEVASVTDSVIVTRWVPYASLEPIAMSNTPVSPARAAPPDPTARILVGHRLDRASYGWSAVHAPEGFVPASFAGVMYTEPEPPEDDVPFGIAPIESNGSTVTHRSLADRDRRFLRYASGELRSAADDAAPVRFTMSAPMVIELRAGAPNDYVAVTLYLPFAELDGFWKRPLDKPRTTEEEAEAEIEIQVPQIHSPIAAGTCLYDAPKGRLVGMIRSEDAFAMPVPSKIAGWYAATIPTIWGPSTYYIDTVPIAPPPPEPQPSSDELHWKDSWTNEW